jgi:hypothetical protein
MNDDIPLEVKIAQAEQDNLLLDAEIATADRINSDLRKRLEYHRLADDAASRKVAYYLGLIEENKEMERELARIEGRKYCDPDDPDCEYPEPPDE